jgi:hypothetical protein
MLNTIDGDALKQAILDLFEEWLAWQREKPHWEGADAATRERIERSMPPNLLPPGYYSLARYLLWLEGRLQVGAPVREMTAVEADGLYALAEARKEFARQHPPCTRCGELQDGRFALMCWSCGLEFER